jgi:D-alanyl-D-alanine carboxypeptidase
VRTTSRYPRHALLLRAVAALALAFPFCAAVAGVASVQAADASFGATLEPAMLARMKELRVPGAVAFVDQPGIGSWTAALGVSNLKTGEPMRTDMHLRIGSVTKTFTGTVILQLVDEGKLRLDDPVARYLPEVPNGANITIRQLLNMTSGLASYTQDLAWNQALDANPQRVWTPQELVAIGLALPPEFAPGEGYYYSNTNTVLLGMIIERITGKHVEDEYAARIFAPLGMRETSMPPRDVAAIPAPFAHGYMYGTNVEDLTATVSTGEAALRVNAAAGLPGDWTGMSHSWAWAAGGAVSTVRDMGIYAKALATGALISPAMQKERLTFVQTASAPGAPGYGLAVANIGGYIGHTGELPGFQIFEGYNAQTGTTIVVMTNLQKAPDGHSTANELTMVILAQLGAMTAPSLPAAPVIAPAAPAAPVMPANQYFVRRLGEG